MPTGVAAGRWRDGNPRATLPASFACRERPWGSGCMRTSANLRRPPHARVRGPPPTAGTSLRRPPMAALPHFFPRGTHHIRTQGLPSPTSSLLAPGNFAQVYTREYIRASSAPVSRPLCSSSLSASRALLALSRSLSRRNGDGHHWAATRVLLTACLMSCARSPIPQVISDSRPIWHVSPLCIYYHRHRSTSPSALLAEQNTTDRTTQLITRNAGQVRCSHHVSAERPQYRRLRSRDVLCRGRLQRLAQAQSRPEQRVSVQPFVKAAQPPKI